jgi:hypothetical protein
MHHPKRILIAATLVVLLLGAGVVWRITPQTHTATLADGTVVEYLGITDGTKPFSASPSWQQFARRILPKPLQGWLPPDVGVPFGFGVPTIYLKATGPSAGSGMIPHPFDVRVLADNGVRYEEDMMIPAPNYGIKCCLLRSYPRRQEQFKVEIVDQSPEPLTSFFVDNPLPPSSAVWRPEPFPQRRTNGPVVLTFLGPAATNIAPGNPLLPHWKVESSDPRWGDAAPGQMWVSDASGNWGRTLDPTETAWGLKTTLRRTGRHQFAARETIILTNMPIPKANGFLPIQANGADAGVGHIQGFLGGAGHLSSAEVAGSIQINSRNEQILQPTYPTQRGWQSESPYLRIDVSGLSNRQALLVITAHDDQNREIRVDPSAKHFLVSGEYFGNWPLELQADAKSITVEINVSFPLEFDFLVDPKELMTRPWRQDQVR